MPRTRARLTISPPERAEEVTRPTQHHESLRRTYDRHSASRLDEALEGALRVQSASDDALSSPDRTPAGYKKVLKHISAEMKKIVKNLSRGRSRDDAHQLGGPCSPAGSPRPRESGRRHSVSGYGSMHPTGAPRRSSALHIREPSVPRGGDGQFTSTDDEDTGLPARAREQYTTLGDDQWQPGFLAYSGQSSSGFGAPPYVPGQSSSRFGAPPYVAGQSSSGFGAPSYVPGQSSSAQPELDASTVDEFLGLLPQADHDDMYAYQALLRSQPTGPPPPQRSPYPLRTDTRSPDRWTYSAGHARRKTRPRTRTQPQQGESSG